MGDFIAFATAAQKQVKQRVEKRVRAYAMTLLYELQSATPYATGQARASWLASVGTQGGLMFGPGGLTGDPKSLAHGLPSRVDVASSLARSESVIKGWKHGQRLTIYNALPYITALNTGRSRQASAGFVEAAMARASAKSRGQ